MGKRASATHTDSRGRRFFVEHLARSEYAIYKRVSKTVAVDGKTRLGGIWRSTEGLRWKDLGGTTSAMRFRSISACLRDFCAAMQARHEANARRTPREEHPIASELAEERPTPAQRALLWIVRTNRYLAGEVALKSTIRACVKRGWIERDWNVTEEGVQAMFRKPCPARRKVPPADEI